MYFTGEEFVLEETEHSKLPSAAILIPCTAPSGISILVRVTLQQQVRSISGNFVFTMSFFCGEPSVGEAVTFESFVPVGNVRLSVSFAMGSKSSGRSSKSTMEGPASISTKPQVLKFFRFSLGSFTMASFSISLFFMLDPMSFCFLSGALGEMEGLGLLEYSQFDIFMVGEMLPVSL